MIRRGLKVALLWVEMLVLLYPLIGALTACRRGRQLLRGRP